MYIFRNCTAFRRTVPLLQYDETKPEDLDTEGEDHVADEMRYFLMSRPVKPHVGKTEGKTGGQLQLLLDISPEEVKAQPRPRLEIKNNPM